MKVAEQNTKIGHAILDSVVALKRIKVDDLHIDEVLREALCDLTTVAGILIGQGANATIKPQENKP